MVEKLEEIMLEDKSYVECIDCGEVVIRGTVYYTANGPVCRGQCLSEYLDSMPTAE